MTKDKRLVILLSVLPLFLFSCSGLKQPRQKVDYYTLEYEPPETTDLAPIPYILSIEDFSVAPTYNSNRIIYREGAYKRDAYIYHRWKDNPGAICRYLLGRDLRESGIFKAVLDRGSSSSSHLILEGSVDEFCEWDMEDNCKAVLAISITLRSEEEPDISKSIIIQRSYSAEQACKQRNPAALAEAMSQAMADISKRIIEDIYISLK